MLPRKQNEVKGPILAMGLMGLGAIATVTLSPALPVWGQISPDGTIPTQINIRDGRNFTIDGGSRAGSNLFHSFRDFSVPTGGEAFFNNDADISNIISRVTGGRISNIDGLIRANGTANLFLLNPAGLIFGPGAKLDIGGSFIGSTASGLLFADGTEFSALDGGGAPLLTVNAPVGLQFRVQPGPVVVQGRPPGLGGEVGAAGSLPDVANSSGAIAIPPEQVPGGTTNIALEEALGFGLNEFVNPVPPEAFAVPIGNTIENVLAGIFQSENVSIEVKPGRTLALVGGEVVMPAGQMRASQGRIEIGSVGEGDLVSLMPTARGLTLGYERSQNFQNISLSGLAFLDVSGLGGGSIQLRGAKIDLSQGSNIFAATLGNIDGGEIKIKARELALEGNSLIGAIASSGEAGIPTTGNSGEVVVETETLTTRDSSIFSISISEGRAGDITVKAPGGFIDMSGTIANGLLTGGLTAATLRGGDGGNITVEADRLILSNGSQVSAVTAGSGRGGSLTVKVGESIELLQGRSLRTRFSSGLFSSSYGAGTSGDIFVETGRLIIEGGAAISASARRGAGGNVTAFVSDYLEVTGTNPQGQFPSSIDSVVLSAPGENNNPNLRGGDVEIVTDRLAVRDGAHISVSSFDAGKAGNLSVRANSIELSGIGPTPVGADAAARRITGISSEAQRRPFNNSISTASGGNLAIATENLLVRDGAQISAATRSSGNAGNLTVNASQIEVVGTALGESNFPSRLSAQTADSSGRAGDLTINTGRLTVRDGGEISASSLGSSGDGGNLTAIASEFIEVAGTSADGRLASNLSAKVDNPEGSAASGSLTLTTERLRVRDGAEITVSNNGSGDAGNLEARTTSTALSNGTLSAETASGDRGNIIVSAEAGINLREGARITTNATDTATGGNINLDTNFLIAFPAENSDITANAELGEGGSVNVTAQGVFGIEFREVLTPNSDITVTSNFGRQGEVTFNTPDVDISAGLVELPENILEPNAVVARACPADSQAETSSFTILGRGGLPPSPTNPLSSDLARPNVSSSSPQTNSNSSSSSPLPQVSSSSSPLGKGGGGGISSEEVRPARGWTVDEEGRVVLTTYVTADGSQRSLSRPKNCP
jgi:filamentous hemagglutinin family protein